MAPGRKINQVQRLVDDCSHQPADPLRVGRSGPAGLPGLLVLAFGDEAEELSAGGPLELVPPPGLLLLGQVEHGRIGGSRKEVGNPRPPRAKRVFAVVPLLDLLHGRRNRIAPARPAGKLHQGAHMPRLLLPGADQNQPVPRPGRGDVQQPPLLGGGAPVLAVTDRSTVP